MSTRPVSCYALFECMAASSQHPGCLSGRHLCHSAIGGLSGRYGLYPSRAHSLAPLLTKPLISLAFGVWSASMAVRPPPPSVLYRCPRKTAWLALKLFSKRENEISPGLIISFPTHWLSSSFSTEVVRPSVSLPASACPWVAHPASRPTARLCRCLKDSRFRCRFRFMA